jgi:hypothetical protein
MAKYVTEILEEYKGFSREDHSRILDDGIYDVTGIEDLEVDDCQLDDECEKEVRDFISRNPEACLAHAYDTGVGFLLARRPEGISSPTQDLGSGFNYGSSNIIRNCPQDILILAEND